MKVRLNNPIRACIDYCIVFFVIMRTYSMLSRDQVYGFPEHLMDIMLGVLFLTYVFFQIITGKRRLSKKYIYHILLVLIISFCAVAFHSDGALTGMFFYVFPMTASAFYLAFKDQPEDFWKKFVNVMTIMAVVSLFLYFAGSVFDLISPTRLAAYKYFNQIRVCNTYFGLQYEAQRAQSLIAKGFEYRNCGFFIEAPMYNILLDFAFAGELSFRQSPRKKVLIILAATIITTMTTTGILFLGAMMAIYVFSLGKGNRIQAARVLLIPVIALIAFYFVFSLMETKMQTSGGSGSVSIRVDHMLAFLKMFLDYPLFGAGYGADEVFYRYSMYNQGYSVGLPAMLGYCGIFMFLLYLIPLIDNVVYAFRKDKKQLFFAAGSCICLFLTAVVYHPIMYMTIVFQLMVNTRRATT